MRERKNLNLLVTLDALLEAGSVSAAARRLGMSQSALSHALADLRAMFGDALLVRVGDRMVPTPRAEAMRPSLAAALRAIERVVEGEAAFDAATSKRAFNLAMRDQFVAVIAPPLYRRLHASAGQVSMNVAPFDRGRIAEQLASGAVDVAVGVDPPEAPGLKARLLYREGFSCLVRHDHPATRLTIQSYADADHLVVTAHGGHRSAVDEALAARGLKRRVAMRVPYFLAAPLLLAESDLVLTLPTRLADMYAATPLRRLKLPVQLAGFNVHVLWHTRYDTDTAVRWLLEQVIASVSRAAP